MNADEQLRKLKQTPPQTKAEIRRKITTIMVLAISVLMSVLFLVYAFSQKLEADKQAELAMEMKLQAEKQREVANRHKMIAEYEKHQAVVARALAEEALANCEKSKRK